MPLRNRCVPPPLAPRAAGPRRGALVAPRTRDRARACAAYGDHKYPHVPAGSVILFKIEVVSIFGTTKPTTHCHPGSYTKCTDKEKAYIEKQQSRIKTQDDLNIELDRLHMLEDNGHLKDKDLDWLHVRKVLLQKMIVGYSKEL